ncbi:MAG: hypothetical protein ACYTG5_18820, partial [Planctomycetota bacterium]
MALIQDLSPEEVGRPESFEPSTAETRAWKQAYRRMDYDLLRRFRSTPGEMRAAFLLRHESLNPADRVLSKKQVS